MPILRKSRAINLALLNISTSETLGAQLHMLSNIPKKIHISSSNIFGMTQVENEIFFNKSRVITLSY